MLASRLRAESGRMGRKRLLSRTDYDRYVAAFNAKDYDAVADFYVDPPLMTFFGMEIRSRQALKDFYAFLHDHVNESVRVLNFAASETLTAIDAVIRVEGVKSLTREALDVLCTPEDEHAISEPPTMHHRWGWGELVCKVSGRAPGRGGGAGAKHPDIYIFYAYFSSPTCLFRLRKLLESSIIERLHGLNLDATC